MKKAFVKSYGCQMNAYDATRMADVLGSRGLRRHRKRWRRADVVILNTCHIREKAADKVYSELGRLRVLKSAERAEAGHDTRIVVAGCVAQAEGKPRSWPARTHRRRGRRPAELPSAAATSWPAPRTKRVVDTEFPVEDKFDHLPKQAHGKGSPPFLTVQEGCDKFCAFCVVPYTRGAEVSRSVNAILAEARGAGARRRARDHADRPERQRLSRPRPATAPAVTLPTC